MHRHPPHTHTAQSVREDTFNKAGLSIYNTVSKQCVRDGEACVMEEGLSQKNLGEERLLIGELLFGSSFLD